MGKWGCIAFGIFFLAVMHSDYQQARVRIEKTKHGCICECEVEQSNER